MCGERGSKVEGQESRTPGRGELYFPVGTEKEGEEAQLKPQEPQRYTCQRETLLLTLAHAFLHLLMNHIFLPHF